MYYQLLWIMATELGRVQLVLDLPCKLKIDRARRASSIEITNMI